MDSEQKQFDKILEINQSIKLLLEKMKKNYFPASNYSRFILKIQRPHLTIIETLMEHHYFIQEIPSLIQRLSDKDASSRFYGIIGLNRFSNTLINPANELQIFNTGIMLKLTDLLYQHQFPYLQYSSLTLLNTIEKVITRENYPLYFSQITLRSEILLQLIHVDEVIFHQFQELNSRIKEKGIRFNITDNNLDFLTKIAQIISNSKLDPFLLTRIGQILKQTSTNNRNLGYLQFFKKYYEVCLALLEQMIIINNKIQASKIIRQFEGCRFGISLQVSASSEIPEFARFYRRIIEVYLQRGFNFTKTVFVLITSNSFTQIISNFQLIEKIGQAMQRYLQKPSREIKIGELFQLLGIYLTKINSWNFNEKSCVLVNSSNIFTAIPALYELRQREITKQIHNFICLLIGLSDQQIIYELIRRQNLISLLLQYCSSISDVACQSSLKILKITLIKLNKKKNKKYIQRIRELIGQQDNLQRFKSIKKLNRSQFAFRYCNDIIWLIKKPQQPQCRMQPQNSEVVDCQLGMKSISDGQIIQIQQPNVIQISSEEISQQ